MGSKKKNRKNKKEDNNIITDPRFASVHWDPRFKNAPKHKAKVEIDDRFKAMFTDPRFASSSAPSDKRGKLKKKADPGEALRHYYQTNEDQGEVKYDKVNTKEDEEEDELSDEEVESEKEVEKVKLEEEESESEEEEEKANLEEEESESEELEEDDVARSESETTTDTGTDDDEEEDEVVFEDGMPAMQNENIPEIEKETHRLAVVNLDWRYVKAVDLFVVLRSFLPKGGEMKSVAVYPSDFGIQRMKEEEIHGPVGLFDKKDEEGDEESDDDDDDDELINQKMRAYEKSRLRYYYAVVECDSIATADYLYRNCDGVEFERSSNTLDLRFIPDSLEIKHPPRDIATEVPSNYVGLDFQTRALQQSKIDISWDEDEPGRRTLKRKFTADQLDEMEMKEFLASDESESDEAADDAEDKPDKKSKKRDMYRALIQSGDGDGSDEDGEEDGQDMEVTFNTGLEDLSKRILEKKDRESETVWDAYLRKRREKKKAKRNRSNDSSEDESSDSDQEAKEEPDDFFIEEPSVKKSKKESRSKSNKEEKQRQDMEKEAEASRNELELLLADDKGADKGVKGYNLKRKNAKGKKGKEVPEENNIPTADLEDPRFAVMFTSPLFALDPTDPQFKRSATFARQAALRQQKGGPEEVPERVVKVQSEGFSSKIEKSSLIKSIKMKAKPFERKEEILQFQGKKETKVEQDPRTLVQPVKKKAKVGRK